MATSPETSSTGASRDQRAERNPGATGHGYTLKVLFTLGIAYFINRALGHHRDGKHHFAAGCWGCAIALAGFLFLGFCIGTAWLPPANDFGAPARELIYNKLGLRLPSFITHSVPTLKPTFALAAPGSPPIPGSEGRSCLTGEIISVSFKVEDRTTVLMFGYDGKDVYRLERSPLVPISYGTGEVSDRVQLSKNAPGESLAESIFVVWSRRPFDPESDVFSQLYKLNAGGVSRGGVATHPQLQLAEGLLQDSFTCIHTNAPNSKGRSQ